MNRREIIAGLGGAAAWPVVARAQQPDRTRRIGILLPVAADDAVYQTRVGAFLQALALLGWTVGRNLRTWVGPMAATCGWTFGGTALTSIGYARSRRSWSPCNPTSS